MSLVKYLKEAKHRDLVASIRFKNGAVVDPASIIKVGNKNVTYRYTDGLGRLLETCSAIKDIEHLSLVRKMPGDRNAR